VLLLVMAGDGMILLRRKGFDPDIAKEMRSFKHEEESGLLRMLRREEDGRNRVVVFPR
jgi:hypothetical protein